MPKTSQGEPWSEDSDESRASDYPVPEASEDDVAEWIDKASYRDLLTVWRYAKSGDRRLRGANGQYFAHVMAEKRAEVGDAMHTAISKAIGWEMCGLPEELQ